MEGPDVATDTCIRMDNAVPAKLQPSRPFLKPAITDSSLTLLARRADQSFRRALLACLAIGDLDNERRHRNCRGQHE